MTRDSQLKSDPGLMPTISPDDLAWRAIVDATRDSYEVLGELARDADGGVAFIGRPIRGGDHVILKLEPESGRRYSLFVLTKFDQSVPAPRIACSVCSALVASWRGSCPACGSAIGAGIDAPVSNDALLAFHQFVTGRYRAIAEFPVDGGGPAIYLVRARDDAEHSLLRLAFDGALTAEPRAYAVDIIPLNVPGQPASPVARERLQVEGATAKINTPTPALTDTAAAAAAATTGERVCPQCGSVFGGTTLFCPRDGASLRPVAQTGDLVGQLIDDRYYVEQRLGEGGMGEVYIAQQVRTGRKCALKLMHRAMTHDADAVGRFRREATSACAISHAHVATIYDSGETSDHRPYFAMEFVDGRPLSHVIRDEERLSPWRAADIARQIAEGLAAAHDIEIVHRDLKPDNVMLGAARGGADFVKLVDFGIAKPTHSVGNTLTKTGFILGTPAYMSPEQICADRLDGRTDLYSLGCVLYEMLIGASPFAGGEGLESVMMRRLTDDPRHPREIDAAIPEVLDDIVMRLLQRSADDRYPDARAAADALAAAQDKIDPSVGAAGRRRDLLSSAAKRTAPGLADGVVEVTLGERAPRRSRDATPAAPLSPSIPFASPTTGRTRPVEPPPASAPKAPPRSRRGPLIAAGALVVIAGAGLFAWRQQSAGSTATPVASVPAAQTPPAALTPSQQQVQTAPDTSAAKSPVVASPPPVEQRASQTPAGNQTGTKTAARPQPPAPSGANTTKGASSPGANTTAANPPATPPTNPSTTQTTVQPTTVPPPSTSSAAASEPKPQINVPAATVDPSVAAAAAAERVESGRIRESVDTFVRGIATRQIGLLRQVWPSMPDPNQKGYEAMFKDASDLSAQLIGAPAIVVRGTNGDATFTIEMTGRSSARGTFTQRTSFHARLQKTDQRWIFSTLDVSAR
jgi:serine/threonine-protein kinase